MTRAEEAYSIRTPVVVVGGGPVGMVTAYELSQLGIPCLLAEQSTETTKWPKMDLINCRTMEIFRMLGIAGELRAQKDAVAAEYDCDTLFFTSCGPGGQLITRWPLPSVHKLRELYTEVNDGSHPAEPHQRCSQIVLETWLKQKCLGQPSIDYRLGWKYISHIETTDGVYSKFVDTSGQQHTIFSDYLVGADGAASRVRKNAGIRLFGAPAPVALFMVHFKSRDLAERRPFGRFWHLVPPCEGFIIDQDENDTFTAHMALENLSQDVSKIDPYEWVYKVFGGAGEPFRFKIDEILVTSVWRPNFAIAEHYLSSGGRILLAGDAAHRNPPHGGYGMNSGVEDALAIAWRLAAIHGGYGGSMLLQTYEDEQRPNMIRRLERCSRHVAEHFPRVQWFEEAGSEIIMSTSVEGEALREKLRIYLDNSGAECNDRGIELDSRYKSPAVYLRENEPSEPLWTFKSYTPSTYPGSRAPHVFLKDRKTSILDSIKSHWTLFSFDESLVTSNSLVDIAKERRMPFQTVVLVDEDHVRKIWEYDLVLVRPDGHVAWRDSSMPDLDAARFILDVVTGFERSPNFIQQPETEINSLVLPILNYEYPTERNDQAGERPYDQQ